MKVGNYIEVNETKILDLIKDKNKITIICHMNPDGDAIGSLLGTYHILKQFIKEVVPICPNEIKESIAWLPGNENIIIAKFDEKKVIEHVNTSDFIIFVDGSAPKRYGDFFQNNIIGNVFEKSLLIDHHEDNTFFTKYVWEEVDALSTSTLIYRLAEHLSKKGIIKWSKELAYCLFTGIKTDSVSFSTPSVKAEDFYIAAKLVERGADPHKIHKIVQSQKREVVLLKSFLLMNRMEYFDEYKTIFIYCLQEDLKKFGVSEVEYSAGAYASELLNINGILLVVSLKESEGEKGEIRISFRSAGDFPANEIAQYFNGGGHRNAAGANLKNTTPEEIRNKLLEILPLYKKYMKEL